MSRSLKRLCRKTCSYNCPTYRSIIKTAKEWKLPVAEVLQEAKLSEATCIMCQSPEWAKILDEV